MPSIARQKVAEWRSLLRRHVPQARQILGKVLRDKLVFRPERRGRQQCYRFTGEGTIVRLLTGLVPEFTSGGVPKGSALSGLTATPPKMRGMLPLAA